MRLEMRGVDHHSLRPPALVRQRCENLVEHPQAAPANEPVIDRLMRTILGRGVTPAKPIPDHEHDGAHNPPVIHPRDAVRQRKIALDPAHLALPKAKTNQPWRSLPASPRNQPIPPKA